MVIISINSKTNVNTDSTGLIQLKILLKGSKPPIWRRILVNNNLSFSQLHEIIQVVMGWENYHLYSFDVNGIEISDEKEEDDFWERIEILKNAGAQGILVVPIEKMIV